MSLFSRKEREVLSDEEQGQLDAELEKANRRVELKKSAGWELLEAEWLNRLSDGFAEVLSQAARCDREAVYAAALKMVNYAEDVRDMAGAEAELAVVVAEWRRRIERRAEKIALQRGRTRSILGESSVP